MTEVVINTVEFGKPTALRLDLSRVNEALNALEGKIQQRAYEEEQRRKETVELLAEKERHLALKEAIKSLLGLEVSRTNITAKGTLEFVVIIKGCETKITLDSSKRIESIEFADKSYSWINVSNVIEESRQFEPPNDLRCAITRIADMVN
eukprot:gene42338-51710_t